MSDKVEAGRSPGLDGAVERADIKRIAEALLFAAEKPLSVAELAEQLPATFDALDILDELQDDYAARGVNLVAVDGRWQFRTAQDLSFLLRREVEDQRRLSRAAVETLAIIAYHQPVTRGEIEDIRGVSISKGTLDVLVEAGWARPRGRKQVPGRPMLYGTTAEFLVHFGLESLDALPGLTELKQAGLLDSVDLALEKIGTDVGLEEDRNDPQIDLEDAIDNASREAGEKLRTDIFTPEDDA